MAAIAEDVNMSEGEEEVTDLRNDEVVTKYKAASDIANKTLGGIIAYSKAGMKALDVCKFGDTVILKQCESVYKSKKSLQKGVAFPTCISVNEVVCHYSPLESDADTIVLKAGDVCKVDLGVHVDGYIAVAAHTFVVPGEDGTAVAVQGKAADVIKAAYIGAEAAVKLIKPGATNKEITALLAQVGEDFGVNPLQGVLMHELKQ
jgi:curved DNA binding protein